MPGRHGNKKIPVGNLLFLCNRQPGDQQTSMQQAGPINSAARISQIHGQNEQEGSGLRAVICTCANVTFSVVRAMNLVRFGFSVTATSASSRPTVSTSLTARAGTSDETTGPTLPPVKRRCFNIAWKEGSEWLNYDANGGVIFWDWCQAFSRSDARNQFITGSSSMKLESIKNTSSPNLTRMQLELTMLSSGQITPLWSTHCIAWNVKS